ncbi:MAG: hypothetical protein ABSD57_04500 [Verrucomicrobiota bacterium]|jgi:hypothetical protein
MANTGGKKKRNPLRTWLPDRRGAMDGAFGVQQGGTNWRLLFFELFVVFSLSVTYCFLVEYFAFGGPNNSTNNWVFTSCSIPVFHLQELGDVWKGRLSGLLLSGWLFDFLIKGDKFPIDQFSCLFGLYQSLWLFLLFLTVILALRHSLFINLGIFAGLIYNFTPASILYFFPWDLPAALFSTLACLFFSHRKMGMMIASVCAGCFFKESVLAFALLVFFIGYWKWWKRIALFLGVLTVYAIGKKLMLHHLHLDVAAFPVGNATNLSTLCSFTFLKLNLKTLLVPTWNHVLFVNGGTLAAVLLLGWSRRFLPFMAAISVFLGVQLMYGGFGEFHTFIQILPLSLILLSEWWEEHAGSGAAGELSAGSAAPAWAVRETFPVLIPLAIVLIGLSTGVAAWHYYNIFENLQPARQMQFDPAKYALKKEFSNSNLEAASLLFRTAYVEAEVNLAMNHTNDLQACNRIEADCQFFRGRYAEAEMNLAGISAAQRQLSNAINHLQRVLELDTNSVRALNNLAFLRATASDPSLRNGNEAVRLAERACQQTQYKEVIPITTLAAAYAEAGRFDDAIVTAQKARAMALAQGQKETAALDEHLLELFKSGRAYYQEVKAAP